MITALVLVITFILSTCHSQSHSPDSIKITAEIADRARANLTKTLGPKFNSKIESSIGNFEKVAPEIIDKKSEALMKDLKANPDIAKGPFLTHKLAVKYATSTSSAIKAQLKALEKNEKRTLQKRVGEGGAAKTLLQHALGGTVTVVGLMALIAGVIIVFICLSSLVGFFASLIRRFYLRTRFGYAYAGGGPPGVPPPPINPPAISPPGTGSVGPIPPGVGPMAAGAGPIPLVGYDAPGFPMGYDYPY